MATEPSVLPGRGPARWIDVWEPEDTAFWEDTAKPIAWRTLWITTASLTMAFIVWFVVSALVVRLGESGFDLSTTQLFWLTAMPGLAGGTLRIVHTFLIPLYGTRRVVSISTALLLLPLIGSWSAPTSRRTSSPCCRPLTSRGSTAASTTTRPSAIRSAGSCSRSTRRSTPVARSSPAAARARASTVGCGSGPPPWRTRARSRRRT